MQSINLIPQQEIKEQTQEKAVKLSTLFSIGVLVIALGVAGFMVVRSQNLKSQIDALDTQITASRKEISGMSDVEVYAKNLDKKYLTLKEIYTNRTIFSKLSSEISARIPEGVIIESITIQKDSKINMSGYADNYIAIAAFMNNLVDKEYEKGDPLLKPLFTSVTLNSVNLEKSQNRVSYSINVEVDTSLIKSKEFE